MGRRESLCGFCAAAYQKQPPATRLATTKRTITLFRRVFGRLTCHFIWVYLPPYFLRFNTNDGAIVSAPGIKQKKRRYDRRSRLNRDSEQYRMAHPGGGGGRRRILANKRRSSGESSLAVSLTTCPIFLNICNWRSSIWLTCRS